MGRDKALLDWGGQTMLDHMIEATSSLTGVATVSIIGDRPEYHGRGAAVLADAYPGCGPLGGIATALRHGPEDRTLVVAIDMPGLVPRLLNAMISYESGADALVPCVDGPQPLLAIYRRSCLAAISAQMSAGNYRISDIFDQIDVKYLSKGWVEQYDSEARSFDNANTPADYQQIMQAYGRNQE